MKTTLSSKGQLVIPAELRRRDSIAPGEEFEITRIESGVYKLIRKTPPPNLGVVDWLLSCPDKDYFQSIPSESTDSL